MLMVEEVEMKKGDAKLETFLGKTMLSFNPDRVLKVVLLILTLGCTEQKSEI